MRVLSFLVLFILFLGCSAQTAEDQTEKKDQIKVPTFNEKNELNTTKNKSVELEKPVEKLPSCSDTDPEDNTLVKGTVSMGGKSFSDTCVGSKSVEQYSCIDSEVNSSTISCPVDYSCQDGACVKVELPKCTDSDGQDFFNKGQVVSGTQIYQDNCASPDVLREYYCQNDAIQSILRNCPINSRCENGACTIVLQNCVDSDSGLNESTYGEVNITEPSGIITTYEDKCESRDYLIEYYCIGSELQSQRVGCIRSRGEECLRAACQKPRECTDTDGGINSSVNGTVHVIDKTIDLTPREYSYDDACLNSNKLKEYYCTEDGRAVSQEIECNNCNNGYCQ